CSRNNDSFVNETLIPFTLVFRSELVMNSSRPGSPYGSGCKRTAFTTLKIAEFAPMPSASVSTATVANPKFLRSSRAANRTSCRSADIRAVLPGVVSTMSRRGWASSVFRDQPPFLARPSPLWLAFACGQRYSRTFQFPSGGRLDVSQATFAGSPTRADGEDLRRSSRLERQIPLLIAGQDGVGQEFLEQTTIVSLNLHGCRYPSRHECAVGSWVTLQIRGNPL